MSRLEIRCLKLGLIQTNCYLVRQSDSSFLAVIDPGDDASSIIDSLSLHPTHIILTHSHFDHVGALWTLHEKYPSAVIAGGAEEDFRAEAIVGIAESTMGYYYHRTDLFKCGGKVPDMDLLLKDGDSIGPFTVLHTPGHTKGSICLYSKEDKVLFSGDTLFRHSYGRTDLGGSEAQIMKSLRRLLQLDGDTTVYPGHDEPTVISDEKAYFGFES